MFLFSFYSNTCAMGWFLWHCNVFYRVLYMHTRTQAHVNEFEWITLRFVSIHIKFYRYRYCQWVYSHAIYFIDENWDFFVPTVRWQIQVNVIDSSKNVCWICVVSAFFGVHVCSFNDWNYEWRNIAVNRLTSTYFTIHCWAQCECHYSVIGVVEFANAINIRMYGRRL